MTLKLALYGLITIASTIGVISSAFRSYSNFYAVVVYLSNSNGASLILGNFALFTGLCIGKVIQKVLFGELRTLEIEHLYERSWYGFTEMILAMTMFRDDFDLFYGLMFGFLFFVKVFHWLCHDRMEYMVQYQNASRLFVIRMSVVLAGLLLADISLLSVCIFDIYINGVTMIILFASEYAILLADAVTSTVRFGVNLVDLRSGQAWEEKSLYLLYIDLFSDFWKLCIYTAFFGVMAASFGLPLNLIRDLVITARSFTMRVKDLQRYKSATQNMDRLYKAATVAELDAMSDRLCIICRDDLVHASQHPGPWPSGLDETPKKLPCAHIFHRHCLKSWLERQQTCPTCRTSVIPSAHTETNESRRGATREAPRPEPRRQDQQREAARDPSSESRTSGASTSATPTGSGEASATTSSHAGRFSSSSTSRMSGTSAAMQQHPMSRLLHIPSVTLPIIRPESRSLPSTYWRDMYRNAARATTSNIPSIVTSDVSTEATTAETVPLPPSPPASTPQSGLSVDTRLSSLLDAQSNINKAIEDLVDVVKDTNKRDRRSSDGDKTATDADTKRARID
ncbi:hypothetical protein E3P99_03958 [Wallemia hederae]|uniref:RING-type E3 ubiquitin transferase n=1 Tax=Wallemia hederae TaxID=1540922 RepID=A0A4T0FCS2_9BASI|nr:hypothetical protein E3P99_03958 [Wallemia hederae]